LEAALGKPVLNADAQAPRASGTLDSHYSPRKPLQLVDSSAWLTMNAAERGKTALLVLEDGETAAEVAVEQEVGKGWAWFQQAPYQPEVVAHYLYAWLRAMDASHAEKLWIQHPPVEAAWQAVNDRLARAARS
jgi:L-threonylcarbamoyladenylate synthase